jgi:hypothetical protein
MPKPRGYIIYEGKSLINGEPIVGIVTMKSVNIKTGNMASMWILPQNIQPTEAVKSGADEAICGMCPQRHHLGGACYVTIFQAPNQVWKSYQKGNYPWVESLDVFDGITMRFGAYGDPYALPVAILSSIKARVTNNTSYTHQWKIASKELMTTSMASVDNLEEAKEAHSMGYRTFRVTHNEKDILKNEIICPNFTNNEVQCINCKLCSGSESKAKSIVIPVHGAKKTKFVEKELETHTNGSKG